tara:strand:+ start:349 stop:582 length:234 start_codon:yes stop_codon:yes gene_type:complete
MVANTGFVSDFHKMMIDTFVSLRCCLWEFQLFYFFSLIAGIALGKVIRRNSIGQQRQFCQGMLRKKPGNFFLFSRKI